MPPSSTTVTSTEPAPSPGLVAEICVDEISTTLVAATVPKRTVVAPLKFVPVIVTGVPPATGPAESLSAVTVGSA